MPNKECNPLPTWQITPRINAFKGFASLPSSSYVNLSVDLKFAFTMPLSFLSVSLTSDVLSNLPLKSILSSIPQSLYVLLKKLLVFVIKAYLRSSSTYQ